MPKDQLQRFIFDNSDIRGEIIKLESSYVEILENGQYSSPTAQLLGEIVAATGLLSATMKFDGILTLQIRGDGDISLLMADCTRQHNLRGIASELPGANPDTSDIQSLFKNGQLVMTIDPAKGERYQGIVALEHSTLSGCLEGYFRQSEQLPTRLWLFADGTKAGGLLLQALPSQEQSPEERDEYWSHLCVLADTLGKDEFLELDGEKILNRLFHQEEVRLFPATEMRFACSCSQQRTEAMIRSIAREEIDEILEEKGVVEVQCQFCHQKYRFSNDQIMNIYLTNGNTVH